MGDEPLASERLAATEQELRDFSAIVSHDLAASFRHVEKFSQLLVGELGPDASSRQREYGEHVQRAAAKCRQMMDQLFVFSRVQQAPLALARCDATELMKLAAFQLSAEVGAAGAEIEIAPLGEKIVDANLMTLAFREALSNAVKFGRLNVAPRIVVRRAETSDAWTVQIIDNGVGAPLERQERLFGMFYCDDPESGFPGIGAGLAICRRILRRHDGEVRFAEAIRGACLEISLPPGAEEERA